MEIEWGKSKILDVTFDAGIAALFKTNLVTRNIRITNNGGAVYEKQFNGSVDIRHFYNNPSLRVSSAETFYPLILTGAKSPVAMTTNYQNALINATETKPLAIHEASVGTVSFLFDPSSLSSGSWNYRQVAPDGKIIILTNAVTLISPVENFESKVVSFSKQGGWNFKIGVNVGERPDKATLYVTSITGQKRASIEVDPALFVSSYTLLDILWNGKDEKEKNVESGIYVVTLDITTGSTTKTIRDIAVLLR